MLDIYIAFLLNSKIHVFVSQSLTSTFIAQNLFVASHQILSYNTRNASSYRPYACRTNVKQFIVFSIGSNIWNSVPDDIKNTQS